MLALLQLPGSVTPIQKQQPFRMQRAQPANGCMDPWVYSTIMSIQHRSRKLLCKLQATASMEMSSQMESRLHLERQAERGFQQHARCLPVPWVSVPAQLCSDYFRLLACPCLRHTPHTCIPAECAPGSQIVARCEGLHTMPEKCQRTVSKAVVLQCIHRKSSLSSAVPQEQAGALCIMFDLACNCAVHCMVPFPPYTCEGPLKPLGAQKQLRTRILPLATSHWGPAQARAAPS